MRIAPVFVVAVLFSVSFSGSIRADEKSDAEASRAIEAATRELDDAYLRGDAKGAAAIYTENANHFPPNRPIIKGRAAIEKFYQESLDAGFKGMESILTEIEVHGDVAFAAGDMKLWTNNKANAGTGKFTLFWKKIDGKWQIHRDCGNSNMPAK